MSPRGEAGRNLRSGTGKRESMLGYWTLRNEMLENKRREEESILRRTYRIVSETPVVDFHTHLFAPELGSLNLYGIDELLTYHYLAAEAFTTDRTVTPDQFYSWPKPKQADHIWKTLFQDRTPISQATIGVLQVLNAFGFDVNNVTLNEIRDWYKNEKDIISRVLEIAKVQRVTMTNDPFHPDEIAAWETGPQIDPRFIPALRIDPLINNFESARPFLDGDTPADAARFLDRWVRKIKPKYMAISLPPNFDLCSNPYFTDAIIPVCQEHGIAFAMMIGVRRAINPNFGLAGDGVGYANLESLEAVCNRFPNQTFFATTLARENTYVLAVLGRKFPNLRIFGCWWFLNTDSMMSEMTDLRFELLGTNVIPQHSDARVFEQLIYKWQDARQVISICLAKRFEALAATGAVVTDDMIQNEATKLLSGNASEWMKL